MINVICSMTQRFPFILCACLLLILSNSIYANDRPTIRSSRLQKPDIDDYWHFHDVGNLGLTVTNYGVLGEGYNNPDQPSCMYKLYADNARQQIEHMSYGGVWIGGRGGPNEEVRVSTAIVDGVFESGEEGFEFTNSADEADTIRIRSSIVTSPYFDPDAVSHQDFIANFTDVNTRVPGTEFEIPNHIPLGINVHLESYAWNFSFTDAFVILNYTITNVSSYPIKEVYAGFWLDTAVGNMNYTSIYEPGGGWSWYDNLNGFDINYDMGYQYDVDGDDGFAQSYIGMRYLGSDMPRDSVQVNYDQWRWNNQANLDFPDYVMPVDDEGRYEVMRGRHTGKYFNSPDAGGYPTDPESQGSWMLNLHAGPLGDLQPGDSLNVVFAVVCGLWANTDESDTPARRANLRLNSDWAQIAYSGEDINVNGVLDPGEDKDGDGEIDRYILPSPPPSPSLLVVPGDGQVTLYWNDISEEFEDPITGEKDFEGYRIYAATKTAGLQSDNTLLAQFDKINHLGYNTGFEKIKTDTVIDGTAYTYKYTNKNLLSGWPGQYWFAVTAFDQGNPANNLPSLESSLLENRTYAVPGTPAQTGEDKMPVSVFPNPYRAQALWDGSGDRDKMLWFINLPPRAHVRIYTLAGNVVDEFQHNSETYAGDDVRLMADRIGGTDTVLSGGMHAWDLISAYDQAIATGMYLYTVEDLQTGELQSGKFVIIK